MRTFAYNLNLLLAFNVPGFSVKHCIWIDMASLVIVSAFVLLSSWLTSVNCISLIPIAVGRFFIWLARSHALNH